MKNILTIVFIILLASTYHVSAQNKHNLYADVSYSSHAPGLSLIYNYKLLDSFGIGVGAQYLNENLNDVKKIVLSVDLRSVAHRA